MATRSNMQRTMIWIIAITMTVGSVGVYFLVILQNNDLQKQSQAAQEAAQQQVKQEVDSTAYKVEGKVNELQTVDLKVGGGQEIKIGDKIKVHYKGTLAQSGVKFDSSYDRGEPADFALSEGGLIKGWVQGIAGMKVGGKRRLVIPANLAYGEKGYPPAIPGNTDLVFEVEALAINPKQ